MTHALIPVRDLLPHEQTRSEHVKEVADEIRKVGRFTKPIAVEIIGIENSPDGIIFCPYNGREKKFGVILDGHHRVEAMKYLGCQWIPAYTFNYDSPEVSVEFWKGSEIPGIKDLKNEIARRAYSRNIFPPKTTRHTFHVEMPDVDVPLYLLEAPRRVTAMLY